MNNLVVAENKSSKYTLTRIIDRFENTNPIKHPHQGVIKDYIYVEKKRIIA